MEIVLIVVAIVCLSISLWVVLSQLNQAKNSDKITLVKDGKSITISANPSKDDRLKLLNF